MLPPEHDAVHATWSLANLKLTLPSLVPAAAGETKVYHAEVLRSERVYLGWIEPQSMEDGGIGVLGAAQEGAARTNAGTSEKRVDLETILMLDLASSECY